MRCSNDPFDKLVERKDPQGAARAQDFGPSDQARPHRRVLSECDNMSIYATTAHPPSKLVAKRAGGAKLSRAMRDRKLLGNEQHVRFAKNVVVRARPFRSVSDGRFRARCRQATPALLGPCAIQ